MLELKNVEKSYGKTNIIKDINLKIDEPGLYIIKGINGSGKSTLIKIITSIIYKTNGELNVDDSLSYLPDKFTLPKLIKASEYLSILINMVGSKDNATKILEEYQIPDKRIGALSKGNYQKLGIAEALIQDADTYILDEPLDGLDEFAKKLLKEKIKLKISENKRVVMVLHQKTLFNDLSPTIYEIKEGLINEKKKKK